MRNHARELARLMVQMETVARWSASNTSERDELEKLTNEANWLLKLALKHVDETSQTVSRPRNFWSLWSRWYARFISFPLATGVGFGIHALNEWMIDTFQKQFTALIFIAPISLILVDLYIVTPRKAEDDPDWYFSLPSHAKEWDRQRAKSLLIAELWAELRRQQIPLPRGQELATVEKILQRRLPDLLLLNARGALASEIRRFRRILDRAIELEEPNPARQEALRNLRRSLPSTVTPGRLFRNENWTIRALTQLNTVKERFQALGQRFGLKAKGLDPVWATLPASLGDGAIVPVMARPHDVVSGGVMDQAGTLLAIPVLREFLGTLHPLAKVTAKAQITLHERAIAGSVEGFAQLDFELQVDDSPSDQGLNPIPHRHPPLMPQFSVRISPVEFSTKFNDTDAIIAEKHWLQPLQNALAAALAGNAQVRLRLEQGQRVRVCESGLEDASAGSEGVESPDPENAGTPSTDNARQQRNS